MSVKAAASATAVPITSAPTPPTRLVSTLRPRARIAERVPTADRNGSRSKLPTGQKAVTAKRTSGNSANTAAATAMRTSTTCSPSTRFKTNLVTTGGAQSEKISRKRLRLAASAVTALAGSNGMILILSRDG